MRVLNEDLIARFVRAHADSRRYLDEWLAVARAALWKAIQDVKTTYPSADGGVKTRSGGRVTVFDVGGNKYRLITLIIYQTQTLVILELMTHAEYSKSRWKQRY